MPDDGIDTPPQKTRRTKAALTRRSSQEQGARQDDMTTATHGDVVLISTTGATARQRDELNTSNSDVRHEADIT